MFFIVGRRGAVLVQGDGAGGAIQTRQIDGGKARALLTAQQQRRVQGFQRGRRLHTGLQELPEKPDGHGGLPVGGLTAAHAVGQQQAGGIARLKNGGLIAAQRFPVPGAQRYSCNIAKAWGGGGRYIGGQRLRQLGILLPRHLIGLVQLELMDMAQQKLTELVIYRLQQPGKVQATAGKVGREVLRTGGAAAEQLGTGIIEGVVGIIVVGLPAVVTEQAAGAHLLGGAVEQHGGVFRAGRRRAGEKAVVHGAEGGSRCGGVRRDGRPGGGSDLRR